MVKLNTYKPIRRQVTPEDMDQQLRQAAKAMEGKFLEEMVKQMRSTVSDSGGFIPTSPAEKIFREQLDQQYVEKWGDKGGLGLADLVYQQLLDRYGSQLGLKTPESRPQGPIPLQPSKKDFLKIDQMPNGKTSFQFDLQHSAVALGEVTAPWSGQVRAVQDLGDGGHMLSLDHGQGLKSQMVFRGLPQIAAQQDFQAGQKLGLLDREAKSLYWTVDVGDSI